MFFELVSRNSKRNRKENGLFFSTMLISIAAFYLILSLSHQDVMRFLKEMESDAVDRLLSMVPMLYAVTLFILFFLIYFASRYQLESRTHEFGMYLMLGMKRSRLFFLVLFEDVKNSVIALLIGLPIGIVIAEFISLVTARLVGLGIIGHQISISLDGLLLTAAGFFGIKFIAFLILSVKIARREIGELLAPKAEGTKKQLPQFVYLAAFVIGLLVLGRAYWLAVTGSSWENIKVMALTLIFGICGTILLFFGLRALLNILAGHTDRFYHLHIFNFRQLQEMVINKSNSMAATSLLIVAGLCCFGSGSAIAIYNGNSNSHTLDYTFVDVKEEQVKTKLEENNLTSLFSDVFEVNAGHIKVGDDWSNVYKMDGLMEQLRALPPSEDRDVLLNNLEYADYPHIISLGGYNRLLAATNQPLLELNANEAVIYRDPEYTTNERTALLNELIRENPQVEIDGEDFLLAGEVQSTHFVVDRAITLSFALIVTDEVFERLSKGEYSRYVNAVLSQEQTKDKSLIEAVMEANEKLNTLGMSYESYLQNIGRQMFYVVAASYITIYLALVFLIIANTVIGVQFLTQLQKTKGRYQTLIRIGASYEALCASVKKQIHWHFGIPVLVALFSSMLGVPGLLTGILSGSAKSNLTVLIGISVAMIFLICVLEYIYMTAVTKSGNRFLLSLLTPQREE